MSNYPDNCNGSGDDLPWNKPDDVAVCGTCGKPMADDDTWADICDKCIKDNYNEEND